jgi:site-specific DNA recombinase
MTEAVAIYARYSTDRQDARSIDDQERRCREFAAARGFHVTEVFSDAAQSGSHMDRAGMQRLLAASKARGGAPFRAVLVDDLSRLSRDLGNTWRVVFEDLASVGVRVVDVTTGMSSDGAGARLTFGALALVNDAFLQFVKTETHRGLEGRALAGFWTGGRVYGYALRKEENPPDPEHPRTVPVIDESEAQIIRQIFQEYARGEGLGAITARLNDAGVRAPYDGIYSKPGGKGWGQSTVRAILRNERYIGRWTWNKRKYIRPPNSRHRRAIDRPASEWRTSTRPELAIIGPELWAEVQVRFSSRRARGRGRVHGEGQVAHLLSGLLKCGTCGSSMSVVSARVKNGVRYANFGCSANRSKGAAICPNNLCVSERKVTSAVLGALQDLLTAPDVVARFVDRFNAHLAQKREAAKDTTALDRQLAATEKALANLADSVAHAGWSETLGKRLQAQELHVAALRDRRKALLDASAASAALAPHPRVVTAYLQDLNRTLAEAPEKARGLLQKHLGPVRLVPKTEGPDRHYLATGALDLSVLYKTSCGGRI